MKGRDLFDSEQYSLIHTDERAIVKVKLHFQKADLSEQLKQQQKKTRASGTLLVLHFFVIAFYIVNLLDDIGNSIFEYFAKLFLMLCLV